MFLVPSSNDIYQSSMSNEFLYSYLFLGSQYYTHILYYKIQKLVSNTTFTKILRVIPLSDQILRFISLYIFFNSLSFSSPHHYVPFLSSPLYSDEDYSNTILLKFTIKNISIYMLYSLNDIIRRVCCDKRFPLYQKYAISRVPDFVKKTIFLYSLELL